MKLAVIRGVMRCSAATGGLDGAVRKAGAIGRTNGAWWTTPDGGAPLDIPAGGAADWEPTKAPARFYSWAYVVVARKRRL